MVATQKRSAGPMRVEIVSPDRTLDVTEFVSSLAYGYSTQPPWDTVNLSLALPIGWVDKILPGTPVRTGESALYNYTPEPGFWVIIYKEEWPNFTSSTAMAVGHVDGITFGERDIQSISDCPVKGTIPITLQCTGMLAFVGKSNVRLTITGEQNSDGFLYDIESFKGAMQAQLGNLLSNEVGVMLEALWKETVKVNAPQGRMGGNTEAGAISTPQAARGPLGLEMAVVYNKETAAKFAQSRENCIRPVYGSKLLVTPALLPSSSLWQWMHGMFVPSTDVVELFATLEPSAGLGQPAAEKGGKDFYNHYTALGKALGNVQPVLLYRFKPFALEPINRTAIQMKNHVGVDVNSNTIPVAEKLGLFQDSQMTGHSGWMGKYYTLEPRDIFSHQVSYDDGKRVNLVFATPAPVGGYVLKPFSQVGNVVIPDQGQFSTHGLRAFEVDWPYLAVQDLRQTVNFKQGTATASTPADNDAAATAYAADRLSEYAEVEYNWTTTFGPWGPTSFAPLPQETAVNLGQMTTAQFRDSWNTYRGTIAPKMNDVRLLVVGLRVLADKNPRYVGPQVWASLPAVETTLAALGAARAYRINQLAALKTLPSATQYIPRIASTMYMAKVYGEELDWEYKILEAFRNVVLKLKQSSTNSMPTTAQATAGGGSVSAPEEFQAAKTVQDQFSALNELLWSIVGEGERFADMSLQIRGRPLLRQGHWISGDLGPRPQHDTIYRYFTGYIEQVNHSFGVASNGEWQSRTNLNLSRVWFSQDEYEHYTPVAASSLGNQTKSDKPERVLRGKSSGSSNAPTSDKVTLWDLSGWSELRKAYKLPDARKADRTNPSSDYAVRCFIVHHTGGAGSQPHQTLLAWGKRTSQAQEDGSAKETAAHFEVSWDGSIYMYYDPDTDIVNHTRCRRSVDKFGTTGDAKLYAGNISIGIDFTGNMLIKELTPKQLHSGQILLQYLSSKYGIPLKAFPLPATVLRGEAAEMSELVSPKAIFGNTKLFSWDKSHVYKNNGAEGQTFTVFGHCAWDRTQCPGKNMPLAALSNPLGYVYSAAGSPIGLDNLEIRKVTDDSAILYVDYLQKVFPKAAING